MKIQELLKEYVTAYHGAKEHGERKIPHDGSNSTLFGNYSSKRYGIFLSASPEYARQYGDVLPYAIGVPENQIVDLNKSGLIGKFIDWAEENDLRHVIFFYRNQFNETWELFEDEIGYEFYRFVKEKGIKVVKFKESLPTDSGKMHGTTYVVFDVSVLKRNPDPNQPDLFLK